jgi:hypothetical protein
VCQTTWSLQFPGERAQMLWLLATESSSNGEILGCVPADEISWSPPTHPPTHTRTHTHTQCKRTPTHTHTRTHTQCTRTPTHTRAHAHTMHTHAHTHASHTHAHAHPHTHTPTHARARSHSVPIHAPSSTDLSVAWSLGSPYASFHLKSKQDLDQGSWLPLGARTGEGSRPSCCY